MGAKITSGKRPTSAVEKIANDTSQYAGDITEHNEIEAGLEKIRKELEIIKQSADEANEFAQSVINTVREPLISLDQDLRVVTVSRSFYEFFKVKPEDTVGQLIYDLGNKQWDIPKLRELLETILPQKTTFDNYEVEHNFPDIGKKIMLLNARQIERVAGKERIIFLAIEDITDRKKLEEANNKMSAIVESADDAIISKDLEGVILSWNRGAEVIYGYNAGEVIGKSISLLMPPGHVDDYKKLLTNRLSGELIEGYETKRRRKDGQIIYVSLTISPIKNISGEIIGDSIIARDITERKEIEAGLEKTRKELAVIKRSADEISEFAENVINTVREPLIALDQDLRVVKVSHSFYEFFKVKPEDTVGQLIYDLGNKQWDIPKLRELLETILPQKATFDNYEVEHNFATIGRRVMLLNARQIERGAGKERIILLAIEDITERKQVEEKIKRLNADFEERVSQYTAELSASVKELEAFSYSVSHDLKAPLRAMAGFSNILSEDYAPKLDDNGRRLIGVINDNARIMEQLIDDLLKLAYMARQTIDVVDIDVTTLVQSVCHELREELFRDRTIEVSVKPLPAVRADYTLAKQIFTNLISNAMKFTAHKDKAVIEIGGYDKDGERIYYVKDNGAGFDMKYEDKLFGVFQRLHGQDEFSGTGIGLAIVRNAVRRHGGKVWAEAEVGQGATFYFTLTKGEQNEQI